MSARTSYACFKHVVGRCKLTPLLTPLTLYFYLFTYMAEMR